MASNGPTGSSGPGAPGNDAWDEEHLEQALNQLKLLHIQLRGLRTTIPRMMEPLSAQQPSPQAKFSAFMGSVAAAKKEVQDFQELRKSEDMTKIMDHATKRRQEEPNGIKAWRTTDHPDWMNVEPSS
ncbi:hypothetical protein CkaCkLH20_04496 [Colletotrichum karsti]|uniref:Uncharacterized protein n=1 Tax=Colletotrichum karsti TaxID=1095194 RepID=A0A9P6LM33_9PEZI|nr:uncharacterized protein CkaCkLH20_04496 [Colletotrichum karsti]KAF9877920.1 hypothetical protein CkaCkLH20_04496 [Colletotrichum karsti]